jgi:UDP-N-acetylglucosamine 2-epimerase (non-hydrolysing)
MIHVAIGTKAEYIKTAPVLRELDGRGVDYRIIDIGQHGGLSRAFRAPLGVPDPVVRLGNGEDAETIGEVIRWALRIVRQTLRSRARIRRDVFADADGICLVHGDTPSTLFAAVLARRAGLPIAHLESGLRSHSLLHPFPEEMVRIVVMRLARILYPPSAEARMNLDKMGVKGDVVQTPGNTAVDAVNHAITTDDASHDGPGIIAIHRVENLHKSSRLDAFMDLLVAAAVSGPTRFLVHPPTERVFRSSDRWDDVLASGPSIEPLLPHGEFMTACASARWVVTDGGSIQEECAAIGVPTLLWRGRTERPDGVGENVVLSNYDADVVGEFLAEPERYRRPPFVQPESPAGVVADDLTRRA